MLAGDSNSVDPTVDYFASARVGQIGSGRFDAARTRVTKTLGKLPTKRRRCAGVFLDWVQWVPLNMFLIAVFIIPQLLLILHYLPWSAYDPVLCTQQPWAVWNCYFPLHLYSTRTAALASASCLWILLALDSAGSGCCGIPVVRLLLFTACTIIFVSTEQAAVLGSPAAHEQDKLYMSDTYLIFFAVCLSAHCIQQITMLKDFWAVSRQLVSKKKRRFVDKFNDFDLDLSYIERRIIAMGWPSEDVLEASVRNPMSEVVRFFAIRHPETHKVYNLCSERLYKNLGSFAEEYSEVRFPDHNPCRLADLLKICADQKEWLDKTRKNVVAIHCKAGKGRTGMVVACLLMHKRSCITAQQALDLYALRRTSNQKGVTIPSQVRYVFNYEILVDEGFKLRPDRWLCLKSIHVLAVGVQDSNWSIQFHTHEDDLVYQSDATMIGSPPMLAGDVKIAVLRNKDKFVHFWFHTAYNPEESEDVRPRPRGEMVWQNESIPQDQGVDYVMNLEADELDRKKSSPIKHLELVATFCIPPDADIQWAQEERERVRSANSEVNRMFQRRGRKSMEVYSDDTDLETFLSTLCSGYLTRYRHRCTAGERRWCVLHTTGQLHINDDMDMFVVDLTQPNIEKVFSQVTNTKDCMWRVKHPVRRTWEWIMAEEQDAVLWCSAISDAIRLGKAKHSSNTIFSGFFWKLSKGVDWDDAACEDMDARWWRLRLFVLNSDGRLSYYSTLKNQDVDIGYIGEGEDDASLEYLESYWTTDIVVPFIIRKPDTDNTDKILAGRPADVSILSSRVSEGPTPGRSWIV